MTNPLNIRPETFAPLGLNKFGYELGLIFVGEVAVPAVRHEDGDIVVSGFVGRYRTSNKAWPASVRVDAKGETWARFGRDDRAGRFTKLQGVSFEPAAFPTAGRPYWTAA